MVFFFLRLTVFKSHILSNYFTRSTDNWLLIEEQTKKSKCTVFLGILPCKVRTSIDLDYCFIPCGAFCIYPFYLISVSVCRKVEEETILWCSLHHWLPFQRQCKAEKTAWKILKGLFLQSAIIQPHWETVPRPQAFFETSAD